MVELNIHNKINNFSNDKKLCHNQYDERIYSDIFEHLTNFSDICNPPISSHTHQVITRNNYSRPQDAGKRFQIQNFIHIMKL